MTVKITAIKPAPESTNKAMEVEHRPSPERMGKESEHRPTPENVHKEIEHRPAPEKMDKEPELRPVPAQVDKPLLPEKINKRQEAPIRMYLYYMHVLLYIYTVFTIGSKTN